MKYLTDHHYLVMLFFCLSACGQKEQQQETSLTDSTSIDSMSAETAIPYPDSDFTALYGRYTHESSTSGFSSTLVLAPQGLNIAFTIVSSKGESCRGEASGNIAIVSHNENYDTGYWISDDCKLEFIFRHKDKKVDVKEIHICTLHDSMCGFEGTYVKFDSE